MEAFQDSDDDLEEDAVIAACQLIMNPNLALAEYAEELTATLVEEEEAARAAKRPRAQRRPRLDRGSPFESPYYVKFLAPTADGEAHPCDPQGRSALTFRNEFRMPRPFFLDLVARATAENWFPSVGRTDALGQRGAPLGLLMLCALNVLGRATVFAAFENLANVSGQTVRKFFMEFCSQARTRLYPEFVTMPTSQEDFDNYSREFGIAGLHGCVGCADGVHVELKQCAQNLRNSRIGKEGYPSVAFNVTATLRRRILYSTLGRPGKSNDKTNILYDQFAMNIRSRKYDWTWTRTTSDGVSRTMRGPYLIVDNGYHSWPCLVAPMKKTSVPEEIRFSKWLESIRKCIECTFGILKARFTILDDYRLQSEETLNDVWFTCLALHNMLLELDGLDEPFEQNMLLHDGMAIARRLFEDEERAYSGPPASAEEEDAIADVAGGMGQDAAVPIEEDDPAAETHDEFRSRLIQHWTRKLERGEVRWPSRTGRVQS